MTVARESARGHCYLVRNRLIVPGTQNMAPKTRGMIYENAKAGGQMTKPEFASSFPFRSHVVKQVLLRVAGVRTEMRGGKTPKP